jgi:hypothetical protein
VQPRPDAPVQAGQHECGRNQDQPDRNRDCFSAGDPHDR